MFGNKGWADVATKAFSETLNLFWKDNRLLHSHRAGSTRHEGTADDYASLIAAALALHALTGESHIYKAQEITAGLEKIIGMPRRRLLPRSRNARAGHQEPTIGDDAHPTPVL